MRQDQHNNEVKSFHPVSEPSYSLILLYHSLTCVPQPQYKKIIVYISGCDRGISGYNLVLKPYEMIVSYTKKH